jgi:hypothetical protein
MSREAKIIQCPNCSYIIDVNKVLYTQLQEQVKREYSEQLSEMKNQLEAIEEEKTELKKSVDKEVKARLASEKAKMEQRVRNELQKQIEESMYMKLAEKEHVINQMKEQLREAQRKAEQTSMQIQGEVQEIAIENYLKTAFPTDEIIEITKGSRGADVLQVINPGTTKDQCSIYYESKRAKSFSSTWISKFKKDMRSQGASCGVLVTSVLPRDMKHFGLKDGILICTFEEFKAVSFLVRAFAVQIDAAHDTNDNRSDKMSLLYKYLTGSEFKMQVEAIVEGYAEMAQDLDKEKRAMESIWKRREKQIQSVLSSISSMYSSIKGIAGKSIGSIKGLDLLTIGS